MLWLHQAFEPVIAGSPNRSEILHHKYLLNTRPALEGESSTELT